MKTLYGTLLLFILVSLLSAAALDEGVAIFKLKPEYRGMLQKSAVNTGIASIDRRLETLQVRQLGPLFINSSSRFAASELSLIYRVDSALPAQAVVNLLAEDAHIAYAEVVYPDIALAVPDDPNYPASLYFAALEAEAAWDIHKGEDGAGVIMAVVDTGCRWTHPDLAQNVWNNLGEDSNNDGQTVVFNGSAWVLDSGDLNGIDDDGNGYVDDLIGWDFWDDGTLGEDNDPYEASGHGSSVSGIAAARTNNALGISSLAWNLSLMPISSGSGSYIYKGYEGIIYAAENGAKVINCSWGSAAYSQAAQDVIDYAVGLGAVIVAAAGNSNNQIALYPSAYRGVISTAALQNDGVKYSGSSYGAYVDVGAPAIAIGTISGAGYGLVNGATSYASPISTALVGLVRSYYPALTPAQVITRVKGTCDDVDASNPGKENLLGEGKLNARRALEDANPQVDNEVRLGLIENRGPSDANGNNAVEPGELFAVNLLLRNWGTGPANAVFTLSTTSTAVSILDNSEGGVLPADGFFYLENAFSIRASSSAVSQYVSFTLSTTADIPIVTGSSLTFSILIHSGGIFVWEGTAGARDMSGAFIRDTLQGLGYSVVYGTAFPSSFYSFEAVFLSFGSLASTNVRLSLPSMFGALRSYLEAGGRLYMEGAEAIGYDLSTYFPDMEGSLDGHEIMWPLLGIASATDGDNNPINGLSGVSSTPTAGMNFVSSAQTNTNSIDTFTPLRAQSREAFTESDYATVAVVSEGDFGQRSFVFSYALRELTDGSLPSTRANLVEQIMDFFIAQDVTLPVELTSFTATYQNQPLLTWQTASETQLLGYNIYRNGLAALVTATRANPQLIMATGGSSGAAYSYHDELVEGVDSLFYWLEAVSYSNNSQYFGPIVLILPEDEPEPPTVPPIIALSLRAYPNPFDSRVDLELSVPKDDNLRINIYNIRGQLVRKLGDSKYGYGVHHLTWDGRDKAGALCADGIYLMELLSSEGVQRHKLIKQ